MTFTEKQLAAFESRYGDVLNISREIDNAGQYLESGAARRVPKNASRFMWNWLRTAERERLLRMTQKDRDRLEAARAGGARHAEARASGYPMLSREQLVAIAEDPNEIPEMRALARSELGMGDTR